MLLILRDALSGYRLVVTPLSHDPIAFLTPHDYIAEATSAWRLWSRQSRPSALSVTFVHSQGCRQVSV